MRGASAQALSLWLMSLAGAYLIHSTLPDYDQREWRGQRLWAQLSALLLLGSATLSLIAARGVAERYARWPALCARWSSVGLMFSLALLATHKLYALLALRDVLTQSALLLTFTLIGLIAAANRVSDELVARSLSSVRLVTACTYLLAALHKLNLSFLTSPDSCALHGVELSFGLIGAPWPATPELSQGWLMGPLEALYELIRTPQVTGGGVIFTELALAYAVWRSKRWCWPLGLAFHLPLTLTIAPSFATVMLCGYCASTLLRRPVGSPPLSAPSPHLKRRLLLSWALLSCALYEPLSKLTKVTLTLALSLWGWRAWVQPCEERDEVAVSSQRRGGAPARLMSALAFAYALHGLSPYLGLEVQHSGAMLSNLRVDPPCFNSLIAPSWGWDPYILINEARFGEAQRPKKIEALTSQLWGWAALNSMKRNWCSPATRPLSLRGSWEGLTFVIGDLCDPRGLDELKAQHPYKTALPVGWQRLQKNLSRRCDQACVH